MNTNTSIITMMMMPMMRLKRIMERKSMRQRAPMINSVDIKTAVKIVMIEAPHPHHHKTIKTNCLFRVAKDANRSQSLRRPAKSAYRSIHDSHRGVQSRQAYKSSAMWTKQRSESVLNGLAWNWSIANRSIAAIRANQSHVDSSTVSLAK